MGPVSLCGIFMTVGRFVICVVVIRGCRCGLLYALDRAVTLLGDRADEGQ